ncbi:hypothetical protein PGT21_024457 [Puccinia graminis f. sp. tritici]|uniref:Arf-GAP domain-containing protein n=1 Tax=Puccinia graminis f. sp. tritici TaxID=56615 RepID=A0A5B0M600_PUCGR|nr:hypothetical protein PGTUg99_023359 [Puccinia graminis f. sp. tritici]KAA1071971.1 hypothetical protein PGT21_024457 [Puccinia graminis f. sp. tritici]
MSAPTKATAERHQRILLELLKQPGNEVCADCQTRNPRWASWNLGIFICVKCAGIHRKLGTHITKVKSLTLDSWTKEQVLSMKQLGNLKSNQIHNPNGSRNPPPTDLEESERDSQLEKYIRTKYESKRFMDSHPKPGSISSARTSDSSAVSFTMSTTSPAPSPASSIFKQSPRSQLSMPARSSSVAGARAIDLSTRPPQRSPTANAQRPSAPRTMTSALSHPSTQIQPVSQDHSSVSHNPQAPHPPPRPSTAPIPSDGYHSSQYAPPVPTVPSLYTNNPGYQALQSSMAKNHNATLFNQPALHHQQSLNIQLQGNQVVHQVHPNPAPPPRTDGVWGDLMQLTQPHLNHPSQPSAGFLDSSSLHLNSNMANPNSYQPLHSTIPANNNMNGLEVGMGRLMYDTPSTNPFSSQNYASNNRTGAMSAQSQLHPQASYQAPSPFTVVHPPQHSGNPFFAHQTTLHSAPPSSSSSAPFANGLAPNRNPFLSTNNNGQPFLPHSTGFSNY